jgi:hypothetical protein
LATLLFLLGSLALVSSSSDQTCEAGPGASCDELAAEATEQAEMDELQMELLQRHLPSLRLKTADDNSHDVVGQPTPGPKEGKAESLAARGAAQASAQQESFYQRSLGRALWLKDTVGNRLHPTMATESTSASTPATLATELTSNPSLISARNTTAKESVLCSEHRGCAALNLSGACCPASSGAYLSCCSDQCADHKACAHDGLTSGACCPTEHGGMLACCTGHMSIAEDAWCVKHPKCVEADLKAGPCCPAEDGTMLDCCNDD